MTKSWDSENGESYSSSRSRTSGLASNYNVRSANWIARPHFCKHGLASLRTSNTPLNPMRRFSCCSRSGSSEDCGFWKWVDPELTDHYKECISRLTGQIIRAEEQRDQATMARNLSRGRLESRRTEFNTAIVELDLLKAKNDELEGIVHAQFVKLRTTKWVLYVVVAVLFLMLVQFK